MSKRKMKVLALVLSGVFLFTMVGCSKPSDTPKATDTEKVYHLRFTAVNAESSPQGKGIKAWAQELEKRTNGQVKFDQMTWSGALLKPDNYLEGLRDRMIDVAFISQQYHPTKTPLTAALQPTFIDDLSGSGQVLMDIYNSVPELKEEWGKWNVVPVAWFPGADFNLMTNFTFDSIDALKGKKMRAIGSQLPVAVKNWGGIPVTIAAADTYGGLEKGTVDGVVGFPAFALVNQKMAEVSKQVTDFRYGGQAMWFGIGFNKDAYNELPDNIKKILVDIAPIASDTCVKANEEDAMAGYKLAKQLDKRLVQLTPEEALQWQKVINPQAVWEGSLKTAEAAGHKNVRQIMDKMVKALQDYNAKHPSKTIMEKFFEQERAGK